METIDGVAVPELIVAQGRAAVDAFVRMAEADRTAALAAASAAEAARLESITNGAPSVTFTE
mgnify:CR=1 FL=1